jgi:hypothetical protein
MFNFSLTARRPGNDETLELPQQHRAAEGDE